MDVNVEAASSENVIYALDESAFPYPLEPEVLTLWREGLKTHRIIGNRKRKTGNPPTHFNFHDLSDRTSDIIAYESYLYHGDTVEDSETQMWGISSSQRVLRGKSTSQEKYRVIDCRAN